MTFVPTEEQASIIRAPLTPLRVAAGAGTGKTATLAHRVAGLVEEHGIPPGQILGITFTNKAAFELADRIRAVLGSDDPSEEVEVYTYHGFAAQLLAEHGALVGVERSARVITPTFGRQLLFEAIRHGSFERVDITARRHVIPSLLKLEADLSDNLKTAQDLLDRPVALDDEVGRSRAELAGALLGYQTYKRALDALDYGDLIRLAHRLVTRHPAVAERIAARYRAVVLDEYQDTNPAQRLLLQTLFGDGETVVTAVGDLDQTIYEWRGASLANFRDFPVHFPDRDGREASTLHLSTNRRSGQLILDVANRVRTEIAAGGGPPLVPADPHRPAAVQVAWLRTAGDEANAIANEVRRLHDAGRRWSDMAVLFRKNKDIALVRDALDEHEIPVQVANLGGLLGIPEIVEIHAWLRIIASPEDGPALVRILSGSRYRLGLRDLKALTDWVRSRTEQPEEDVDDEHGRLPAHTLIEAIDHLDELELDDSMRVRLAEFAETHRRLITVAQGVSLVELVRTILADTHAWMEIEAMPEAARLSARLNVHRFLDLAEDWSPLDGRPSLEAFLAYLELMQEEQIEELDTARVSSDDAVTLLTVHRAKGLEWPVVFLPALYHNNFPATARVFEDPFTRPATLPDELRLDREQRPPLDAGMDADERKAVLRAAHNDQEWRLAYVAVTRAEDALYMSGATWYGSPQPNTRPVRPSRLVELTRALPGVETGVWEENPGERPEVIRSAGIGPGPDFHFGVPWDEALRSTLADPDWPRRRAAELGVLEPYDEAVDEYQAMLFSLPEPIEAEPGESVTRTSVTGLVTYASCPQRYYWSEVDRLPRRPSPAARRGVELHRRIELHNRGNIPLEDAEDIAYDAVTEDPVGAGGPGAFATFKTSRFGTILPLYVEVPFDLRVGEGAWVRGRIDAIYPDGEEGWEVVDFKSGRRSRDPAALVQLEAYALAVASGGFSVAGPRHLAVTFAYLGDGLEEVREEVDDTWLAGARRHLEEILDRIEKGDWTPDPSPACRHCDFQRFCEPGKAWLADRDAAAAPGGEGNAEQPS